MTINLVISSNSYLDDENFDTILFDPVDDSVVLHPKPPVILKGTSQWFSVLFGRNRKFLVDGP